MNGFQRQFFSEKKKGIALQPRAPINSLNVIEVSEYDNISSFFLQMEGEILAPILSFFFGHAFEWEIFPSIFKIAKVVPIFESGNEQIVKNYPPISLLSTLSKLLEKLTKIRLIKFFD